MPFPPASLSPPARHALLLGGALAALGGCMVGPDYARPKTPSPTRYTETPLTAQAGNGPAQRFVPGQDVAGAWWGLFRSPRLTALVVAALRQNPSLEAARQTMRQAQETKLAQEGGFLPQISGQANRTREEISSGQAGLPNTFPGETYSVYDAQVNVSYTFDIWGQNRRNVEADAAQAAFQRFQLEGATNMLVANTMNAAITAASLARQIEAEEKLVGAERQLLDTVRRQFDLGGATGTDVATQEAQLANTEALVVPLQTQLGQVGNQLAAYTGRVPSEADIPAIAMDDMKLPGELPVTLPARLVEQRPDIRAAEAQLQTATAQLGVAIANRLPQLTLQGNIGSAPATVGKFFTPGEGTFALIMQLAGPLFEGGTLLHQQRAAVAAMKSAAANYQNTVINGFQNVADALIALSHDGQALAANERAEHAAARSLALARMQYGAGGVAYLTVLTSQTQYQNAVIALVRATAARFTDTVALYTALGGGWWNRDDVPPPPEGFWRSLKP